MGRTISRIEHITLVAVETVIFSCTQKIFPRVINRLGFAIFYVFVTRAMTGFTHKSFNRVIFCVKILHEFIRNLIMTLGTGLVTYFLRFCWAGR
jgi:hypothetical protein